MRKTLRDEGGRANRKSAVAPIEETIGYLLRQACKAYRVKFRTALSESRLHVGQDLIMIELWKEDGLSQRELVDKLLLEPSTLTRMLARMEKAGFVKRRPDERDARVFRVYLTEQGRSISGPVDRSWAALEEKALEGLTEEDKLVLRRVLPRINANLLSS